MVFKLRILIIERQTADGKPLRITVDSVAHIIIGGREITRGRPAASCLGRSAPAGRAFVGHVALPLAEIAMIERALAAWDAEAERIVALPVNAERRRIDGMFLHARGMRDWPGRYFPARLAAEAALAAWREKYPDAARAEKAQGLRSEAERLKILAAGALAYDADGSLDAAEQQRRHDAFMAQAEAKETEIEQ